MKLLTVIVPSYNMEQFLPKCLDGIAVGTALMEKLDVIVVNDGSKDRTSEIAHEFAARHPGVVQVVDKANGHYGSCINEGIARARGVFVRVLDADDSYDREEFETFLRRLEDEVGKPTDFILSDFCRVFEADPSRVADGHLPFADGQRLTVADVRPDKSEYGQLALTYRTELVRGTGYRQTEGIPYTDYEWCTLPMATARSGVYFACRVYRYLIGREGQSVSVRVQVANRQAMVAVLRSLLAAHGRQTEMTSEGCEFLEMQTACLLESICKFYGQHVPLKTAVRELRTMGADVRRQPWLSQRAAALRYASFLLEREKCTFVRLLALRCYAWVRGIVRYKR